MTPEHQTSERVAFIGIDAAQWSYMEDLIERGQMPNCAKIIDSSTFVQVSGDDPYRAEATWTEFAAASPPADTGYWSTAIFDATDYSTWEIGAYTGPTFYARQDLRPIVFDIPHVTLLPGVDGIQITGWGVHSPQYPTASKPSNVVVEIDRLFGVHPMTKSDGYIAWHNEDYHRNLTDAMVDGIETKAEISKWLFEQKPDWNLFMTSFSESHVAGHHYHHAMDPTHPLASHPTATSAREHFDTTFRAIDRAIGRIAEYLPDDARMVIGCVHGMQTNGSDVTGNVLFPELLHRLHFGSPLLELPEDDGVRPVELDAQVRPTGYLQQFLSERRQPMSGGRGANLKEAVRWNVHTKAPQVFRDGFEAAYRRLDGKPVKWWEMELREPLTRPIDVSGAASRNPLDAEIPCWYRQYWPKMRFFSVPAFSDGHIRINLEGRERDGIVPADQYDAVCDEIEDLLRRCVDADTGAPVVESVYRVQADDPFRPDGPSADLVVTFCVASEAIEHPKVGRIGRAPLMRAGEHSNEGWLAFSGYDSQTNVDTVYRPADIGPTFMDLLGKPSSPVSSGSSFADEL